MKIKDSLEKDNQVVDIKSGSFDIIADDGRPLFSIIENKDGSIDIHTYMVCKHKECMFDTGIVLSPKATNTVTISRKLYE